MVRIKKSKIFIYLIILIVCSYFIETVIYFVKKDKETISRTDLYKKISLEKTNVALTIHSSYFFKKNIDTFPLSGKSNSTICPGI